jgi:hypothetical protein
VHYRKRFANTCMRKLSGSCRCISIGALLCCHFPRCDCDCDSSLFARNGCMLILLCVVAVVLVAGAFPYAATDRVAPETQSSTKTHVSPKSTNRLAPGTLVSYLDGYKSLCSACSLYNAPNFETRHLEKKMYLLGIESHQHLQPGAAALMPDY